MKRSPSSPSSSSSSVESHLIGHQSEKPKNKRPRPKRNLNKSQINNAQSPNSGKRSSIYRGVTRHRWTGRFEAHLWDKSTWNNIQNKRGRQIYLGAYDNEESAARTYDLAALKYWGPDTAMNFPIDTYIKELEEMQKLSKEEYLASLRRQSSGFSRGVSKYRGVARGTEVKSPNELPNLTWYVISVGKLKNVKLTNVYCEVRVLARQIRHHHNGRWEARIGRVLGNKYLYLGTYSTQEEAAVAYDMAAIEHRGPNAVTNFDISSYADKFKKIALPPDQPDANSFTNRTQPHDRQDQQQQKQHEEQIVQPNLPNFEHPLTFDSPSAMQMADLTDEHEHPWGICLDAALSPTTIPDIPLEQGEELPDLFDNTGFMDDIDSIFDGFSDVTDLNVSGTLNTTGSGIVADNLVGAGQKVQEGSTSISSASLSPSPPSSSPSTPSSSSSSTTTFNDVFNDDL